MFIEIDFNSDEAIYMQLRNQIIMGIATSRFQEGDMLPSVRQLADTIGINMHTVNKAYTVLKQEGYVKVDRRKGAMIAVDIDKIQAIEDVKSHRQCGHSSSAIVKTDEATQGQSEDGQCGVSCSFLPANKQAGLSQ